jgi:thiol-disulfide isomerase/thioredoxin
MNHFLFVTFLIFILTSCGGNQSTEQIVNSDTTALKVDNTDVNSSPFQLLQRAPKNTYTKDSITIESYTFENFEPFLHWEDDYTYVINFWATWCVPCVKELPYFEQLGANYADQKVHVLLVSIDFAKAVETSLIPFLAREKLKSEVILLDDPDANAWIPKVDESWSGAIPATVIYNKTKRAFFEKSFTYEELETELTKFLN